MYNPNQLHRPPPWSLARFPLPLRGQAPQSAKSAERAERIRQLFVEQFRGCAELDDVRVAAINAGLLDTVRDPNSQRNVVRAALSTIAEPFYPGGA